MNPDYSTPEQRWLALRQRDARADGSFVYSVATTGIYCRPACPAKLAAPANIRFHDNAVAARKAGFRPCRRCDPDGPSLVEPRNAVVTEACRLMDASESPPTLAEIAAAVGLSSYHFHRIFKSATGVTPAKYAAARRAEKVRNSLQVESSVTDAIYAAGYQSSSRFYADSAGSLGMSPSEYRQAGRGVDICYVIVPCPLGLVLVAGTARGICRVSFGHERKVLEEEVRSAFNKATFVKPDSNFTSWVKKLVTHLKRPTGKLDLPLDIRCTVFQQTVWQALREIPAGQTSTYQEIAARIGRPTAARAVARACASNSIAVAIPCHRAIGKSGALTGYRWGLERKRRLLENEGAISPEMKDPT